MPRDWVMSHLLRLARAVFISTAALMSSPTSAQTCNPVEFFVADIGSAYLDDTLKIAFVLSTTAEGFGRANRNLDGALGQNFDQAREFFLKEAEARSFQHDSRYYLTFISQHLSPGATHAYESCLETSETSLGLRLRFDRRFGEFTVLKAIWRAANVGAKGTIDREPTVLNGKIENKVPQEWLSGRSEEIILRTLQNEQAYVSISVAGSQSSISVLPEPVLTEVKSAPVFGNKVGVSSGGTSDGHSPWCQFRTVQDCVRPTQPRGYLVTGSGTLTDVAQTGRAGFKVTTDRTDLICVQLWASTGACETQVSISGRVTATERYPAPK
jgi:hypothetical protein